MKVARIAGWGRRFWSRTGDGLLAAGLFAASLILYLQTLAPSVATLLDDSLEFPLVAYELGIAHPTGYPLYTLLGKLFTLGPGANVAWSVNSLSAVAGALTVALVYLLGRELTRPHCRPGGRCLPALLGAVALALSPVFWSQSVIAEVYTLHSVFVVALLWLALRWARRPLVPVQPFSLLLVSPRGDRPLFLPGQGLWYRLPLAVRRAAWRLRALYRRFFPIVPPRRRLRLHPLTYALATLYGFGLTHHRTVLLLVPAVLLFAFLVEHRAFGRAALLGPEHPDRPRWRQISGRTVVRLAVCLLLPLFLYLYLPIRGHVGSLDGQYTNTWRGFWQWVTAGGYSVFLAENPLARDLDAAFYAELFWQQFGPVGLALALLGVVGLLRRPKALVLTGLALLSFVGFAVVYRVPDVEVFFIPAFVIAATWIGKGLEYASDLLRPRGQSIALRRLLAVCCLLIYLASVLQPLVIGVRNYPDLDLSRRWIVHDYGQYVLEQPLPVNATVIGLGGEMNLLRYFQRTTRLRPDVQTVIADREEARLEAIEAALAQGRAPHVTRPLPGLTDAHSLGSVIGLIDVAGELETLLRVGEPETSVPAVPQPTELELMPNLRLVGYGVREHRGHWQAWARLRLWWQVPEGLVAPLKVSARLQDIDGRQIAATDAEPVAGAYPVTAWRAGEVVADAYEIPLPAGLPPGEYRPLVIVYDPSTGAEHGRAELAPVYLEGNPARPPRRELESDMGRLVYASFGDVELLGLDPPSPEAVFRAGDNLPLVLLWQAKGSPSGVLQVTFWLTGDEEVPLALERMGGSFPTPRWRKGQTVRQWPLLTLPGDVAPGTYRLMMRVTRDVQPVPWGRGLLPMGSDLDLGSVQIGRQR